MVCKGLLRASAHMALVLCWLCSAFGFNEYARPAQAGDVQVVHPLLDVCSLLSERTAAAAIGSSVFPASNDPSSQCAWTTTAHTKTGVTSILVTVDWPGPTEVARLAQLPSFGVPSRATERIKDLPAAAVWVQFGDPEYSDHALVVLSGGMKMSVCVDGVWSDGEQASSEQLGAAERVAKEALMNLP